MVPINVPPLRERKEDIPFLAMHFLQKHAKELGSQASQQSARRHWTGWFNTPGRAMSVSSRIRSSEAWCLASNEVLQPADIRIEAPRHNHNLPSQHAPLLPEGETLEHWEQMMIREALRRANGNKSQAARMLGLTRNAFRYRLSQMGLEGGANGHDDGATRTGPERLSSLNSLLRRQELPPSDGS